MLGAVAISDVAPPAVDLTGCPWATLYFTGVGTLSSGVVTIEEAPAPDYAGTWFAVTTFNANDVTGGKTKAVRLTVGAYAFIRLNLTTPLGGGGTLTAVICAIPV